MSHPEPTEPIEHPEGFQPSGHESVRGPESERPDWLVGADEGLAAEGDPEAQKRITAEKPVLRRVGQPESIVTPGTPAPPAPPAPMAEATAKWAAAAPSVPKLALVPRRERIEPPRALTEDDDETPLSAPDSDLESDALPAAAGSATEPQIRPHDEPLWLVWTEAVATNRKIQIGIAAVVVAILAYAFWPREEGRNVPLGQIRKHPDRFEGRSVNVRGQVGEVFDIGRGYVFHLIQGRDTVVVFSPTRHPEPREKLRVSGNVSTGYLDGVPRVAIFETP